MYKTATQLKSCSLRAWDGEIGKVHDLYFDNLHWGLRYFVVDTRKLLKHRAVLISPENVLAPEWDNHLLPVELTKEQIQGSPGLETDKPVSRQYESAMRKHYNLAPYWGALYGDTTVAVPPGAMPPPPDAIEPVTDTELEGDRHLFSTNDVTGHHVLATDGEIGHVSDFLVDDLRWKIRYLVVDTRNWWPGQKVLLSPWWASDIDWPQRRISMDLTRQTIRNSPPYDPEKIYTFADYGQLHDYYGQPRYLTEDETVGEAIVRSDSPKYP